MTPVLVAMVVASGLLLWRWRARVDAERVRARMLVDGHLDGESTMRPTLASLEHLEAPAEPDEPLGSPYRNDDFPDPDDARVKRARNALTTARWLLLSAVAEAEAAEDEDALGRAQHADLRRMTQHRSESEALACIFEAEDCLRTRIVRGPEDGRNLAPFYGRAAELLAKVTAFERRAFGDDA